MVEPGPRLPSADFPLLAPPCRLVSDCLGSVSWQLSTASADLEQVRVRLRQCRQLEPLKVLCFASVIDASGESEVLPPEPITLNSSSGSFVAVSTAPCYSAALA